MYFTLFARHPWRWVRLKRKSHWLYRCDGGWPEIGIKPCDVPPQPTTIHPRFRLRRIYKTYIAPPDMPNLAERTFYLRTNALISWLNAAP